MHESSTVTDVVPENSEVVTANPVKIPMTDGITDQVPDVVLELPRRSRHLSV